MGWTAIAATRPLGGPTSLASEVLLLMFTAGLLADRVAGGPSPWRTSAEDRGTFWLIQAAQVIALFTALAGPRLAPRLDLPAWLWVAGAVVVAAGAALRVWSLRTLGQHFKRDVHVQPDQELIVTGPYRRLRHPSYTGALLLFFGLGIGQANLLSLVVTLVLPTAAYLRRISIEEAELHRSLGSRYDEFARTRQRLIPWIC